MSTSYGLRLWPPPQGPGLESPLPPLPPDVPASFPKAGLLINHGVLAAETLGLDTSELQWRLDAVTSVPEPVIQAYDEEDAVEMVRLFSAVGEALLRALDDDGRPRGEMGERLAASPHLGRDEEGRLYFKSHRLHAIDLRRALSPFSHFLKFAADHGLWLRID